MRTLTVLFTLAALPAVAAAEIVLPGTNADVVISDFTAVGSGAENLRMFTVTAVGKNGNVFRAFDGSFTGSLHQQTTATLATPTLDEPLAGATLLTDLDTHFRLFNADLIPAVLPAETFSLFASSEPPNATGAGAASAVTSFGDSLSGSFGFVGGPAPASWPLAQIVAPAGSTVNLNFELGFGGSASPDKEIVSQSVDLVSSAASVIGRHLFYNNSLHDGATSGAGVLDNAAIAVDKMPLLPGDPRATFTNYSNYDKGINGVIIDVDGLANAAGLSAADFSFRTGNTDDPSQWNAGPLPSNNIAADVRPGGGDGGSDRVTLIWGDGDIRDQWLEVTLRTGGNTGLAEDDVFYFGSAAGDSGQGNPAELVLIDATDRGAVLADPVGSLIGAAVDDPLDYNRDGVVDAADRGVARLNPRNLVDGLVLFIPPGAGAAPLAGSAAVPEPATIWLAALGTVALLLRVRRRVAAV